MNERENDLQFFFNKKKYKSYICADLILKTISQEILTSNMLDELFFFLGEQNFIQDLTRKNHRMYQVENSR